LSQRAAISNWHLSREVDAIVEMVHETVDAVPEVGETMDIDDDDDRPSRLADVNDTAKGGTSHPANVSSLDRRGPNFARMEDDALWAEFRHRTHAT